MKLKLDDKGAVVLQDGKPVYTLDDGRDVPHDAAATVATISRLNNEARNHREAKEALEAKYKGVPDELLTNAEAALNALTTIKNIDEGKLLTAGKVQEIKDAAAKSAQEAVAAATRAAAEEKRLLTEANSKLTTDLHTHLIGGAFAGSKYIAEKLAIPADIAQKVFGDRVKVEGNKLVPMDSNGQPIFSATRHGEHADLEEALPVWVNAYPNRDMILKSTGASGSGANPGSNQNAGGKKAVPRAQWDSMDQAARMAHSKSGGVVSD